MKLGRNDPCTCGSGKKYKKCCQDKFEQPLALQKVHQQAPQQKTFRNSTEPNPVEAEKLIALYNVRKFTELETNARCLLEWHPNSGFLWKVLGTALASQNKESIQALEKAAELLPNDAEIHNNLGGILRHYGKLDCSLNSLRKALKIRPDFAEAHSNLGNTLRELGHFEAAHSSYQRALQINPNLASTHNNLGCIFYNKGLVDESLPYFRRSLELNPDAITFDGLLFSLSHSENINSTELFAEHRRFGEQFETPLRGTWSQHANVPDPNRILNVGIVSGDLRNHAIASFIEPILVYLAVNPNLRLYAYSNAQIVDNVTARLQGYFKEWQAISGLSDTALAEKVRKDNIDILIDLSGHTRLNRLLTFAHKPAPVQVSWMGYPGTTGLSAMDYYLSDSYILPPGEFDHQFTEKIVQLPANAPFLPYQDAPPINSLPALGKGYVTFGSFNRLAKLSPSVIALWAQLLHALPDSQMLIGGMPEDGNFDNLKGWFAQQGLNSERFTFHTRSNMDNYLTLHQQVDFCLDTFPFNGGTTTCHALWMGVPTLTLATNTVPGRTGAGALSHVGLETFVAHDAADFVQKGLYWADNLDSLSIIRSELRERFAHSAIGQPELIAAGLATSLRTMWQRWCDRLPAQTFVVD